MKKFVVLDMHEWNGVNFHIEKEILEEQGIHCILSECKTKDEIIEVAKDADGIGLIYSNIDKEVIDALDKCKVITRYGIGYDSVDIDAATEKGIVVCNIPDYCQQDVATHTMAMLLDLSRKVTLFDRSVRTGIWDSNYGYPINRVDNMTIGLIGFGSIARTFVKYLSGFDSEIISYDPYAPDGLYKELDVEKVSLDNLYKRADIITIHTPLTPETRFLINSESISKMKDGVMIVNTARGALIKLEDLLAGLNSGKIKAAALDVVETEPITDSNAELYNYENLIINPHTAYNSVEASIDLHQKIAYSAIDVLIKGIIPYNAVNKKYLQL